MVLLRGLTSEAWGTAFGARGPLGTGGTAFGARGPLGWIDNTALANQNRAGVMVLKLAPLSPRRA
jgi:hypothetical protein